MGSKFVHPFLAILSVVGQILSKNRKFSPKFLQNSRKNSNFDQFSEGSFQNSNFRVCVSENLRFQRGITPTLITGVHPTNYLFRVFWLVKGCKSKAFGLSVVRSHNDTAGHFAKLLKLCAEFIIFKLVATVLHVGPYAQSWPNFSPG